MDRIYTPHELEITLGQNIKTLRLQKNIDRQSLCNQAGISMNALRNLEGGKGTSLKTLVRVIKALDKEQWINAIAPHVSINPLHTKRQKSPRQRASRRPHEKKE